MDEKRIAYLKALRLELEEEYKKLEVMKSEFDDKGIVNLTWLEKHTNR